MRKRLSAKVAHAFARYGRCICTHIYEYVFTYAMIKNETSNDFVVSCLHMHAFVHSYIVWVIERVVILRWLMDGIDIISPMWLS